MLYSQACAYAIRALAHLHRLELQTQDRVRISDICELDPELPSPFIAKIFQLLAKQNWLQSSRGRHGGFRLGKPATEIVLRDLVTAIDGPTDCDGCVSGLHQCNDQMPCPLHDRFAGVRKNILDFLNNTTLEDMSQALEKKIDLLQQTGDSATLGLTISAK